MNHSLPNMAGIYRFHLAEGRVATRERALQVVIPASALLQLQSELDVDQLVNFGAALGEEVAGRLLQEIPDPRTASAAVVVDHLGAQLAVMGLGSLSVEFWGEAMVFVLVGCPLLTPAGSNQPGESVMSGLLQAVLLRTFGQAARVLPLQKQQQTTRWLVCNETVAGLLDEWVNIGLGAAEVLTRLNGVEDAS